MRATLSGYYRNLQFDQSKTAKELFDVTKQISSGQKIQYAHEDTSVFIDTVRLDNEVTTLTQIKTNSQKALQFSTNSDTAMNQMTEILDAMKVKLIYASNEVHTQTGLNAIAGELRGLESNLIQLANTSIDGKYLFAGSETDTKPIDGNGVYQGNEEDIKAFIGSEISQVYNVNGADLFLGAENDMQRQITTNIGLKVLDTGAYATGDTTLEEITGSTLDQTFYIRGTNHDGTTFKLKTPPAISSTDINDLLASIKGSFTGPVDVTLDKVGHIVVTDLEKGSSKLDFHIVAGNDIGAATDLSTLVPTIEFMKSGIAANASAGATVDSAVYDKTFFTHNATKLESNVSQVVKIGTLDVNGNDISNDFAVDSTKLSDVFALPMTSLHVEGKHLDGTVFNVDLDFTGATVGVSGSYSSGAITPYNIADGTGVDTPTVDVTYRQLMDVVNMAINNQIPADSDIGYRTATQNANVNSTVELSYDGKITFLDKSGNNPTLADLSIYDDNSNDFTNTTGSIATFNTNNALTISDPKTDFFKQINDAITAVELGRIRPDGNDNDPRNGGVENAIQAIDDLATHMYSQHALSGVYSQTLQRTTERTDMLIVTTQTLRSETIDVDIAQASLELKQLELNYQAMLSTVSRISQLSLVNFL